MNSEIKQMYTPIAYGGKVHIENEIILPDYCTDILRVVKTEVNPKITAKNTYFDESGLNVALDGTVLFKVIYLSEGNGTPHSTFFTENFSHNFKVQTDKNTDPDSIFLHIALLPENVACRPSSARRMTIRADLGVMPDIRLNRTVEYFADDDNENFEIMNRKVCLCGMCGDAESDYSVSEKITLPRELPAADEIIDCDMRYTCESLKISDGKAIFTATALFTCFYSSSDGNISFCQPIELSQIIDIPNLEGTCNGEIRFSPTSLRADVDVDNYGENRVIVIDFSYTAHVVAFNDREIGVVADIFSPTVELDAEYGDLNLRSFGASINEKVSVNASVKLKNPETVAVEDIKPVAHIRGWVIENNILNIDGRINLKMIGTYPDGCEGLEENLDFSAHIKLDEISTPQCDLNVSVCEVDCVVTTSAVEVRADVLICGSVFAQNSVHCVRTLNVGDRKKPTDRPPIILYYPSPDETLWDIAKKYSLPQKLLRDFNGMETSKITDSVIKIPTV